MQTRELLSAQPRERAHTIGLDMDTWPNRGLTTVWSPSAEWRAPCCRPRIFGGRIELSSGGVA
eukprot:3492612-Pyramimonas_sp.AAC.1